MGIEDSRFIQSNKMRVDILTDQPVALKPI